MQEGSQREEQWELGHWGKKQEQRGKILQELVLHI